MDRPPRKGGAGATGIKSLRVGFNKVFGYYIEVTRANLALVPDDYERKQTLANAERYVTPALKEMEAKILGAEERMIDLEYQLFTELRAKVGPKKPRATALGPTPRRARCVRRPGRSRRRAAIMSTRGRSKRHHRDQGRAPRRSSRRCSRTGPSSPTISALDHETQVILLTGPNMAGKSTYLRQAALTVLMAQIGSFVPAAEARIGVVDRIFTRVGASDDLATGQSTFMVEMNEVANILNHATSKSLVILDEVGRGTSTFDGLSIAWAVTEYLHNHQTARPKTLFATHYHELTELEGLLPRVKNYSVAVHRRGHEVVFLRRIVRGGADQSYGIEVARLAGLPATLIERARDLEFTRSDRNGTLRGRRQRRRTSPGRRGSRGAPTPRFPAADNSRSLKTWYTRSSSDWRLSTSIPLTPLDTLNLLAQLAREAKEEAE